MDNKISEILKYCIVIENTLYMYCHIRKCMNALIKILYKRKVNLSYKRVKKEYYVCHNNTVVKYNKHGILSTY